MTLTIKKLEGWLTFSEVAELFGYTSRQAVHELVFKSRAFNADDLRYIQVAGTQTANLIRESAAKAEKRKRDAEPQLRQQAAAQREKAAKEHADTVAARVRMRALLGDAGIVGKGNRIDYVSGALGRTVTDWYNLTRAEADKVSDQLVKESVTRSGDTGG